MPRPQRCRRICRAPMFNSFVPEGEPNEGTVTLSLDEYEVIRLVDLENLTHEQCAAQMDISRSTATEIYESARCKIANCIVNGRRMIIYGGNYRFCGGSAMDECKMQCCFASHLTEADFRLLKDKRSGIVRVTVPWDNGRIFQHFGHARRFQVYDTENGRIEHAILISSDGTGRVAPADLLKSISADILICGRIGPGARAALSAEGIRLISGVEGESDAAVKSLLGGALKIDSDEGQPDSGM